ncbi:uncharacterized protein [Haliotis cracherodii]|uniref:uncharacterized protein n=1 Tax=Haliotis cracherodii TaxID=6455 RepID=UPI0039E7C0BE
MNIMHLFLLTGLFLAGIPLIHASPHQVQCLSSPYASSIYARSRFAYVSYGTYTVYPDGILLSTNTTNNVLKLTFRHVEFGPVCSTSYVRVYEGKTQYGSLLKKFCGTKSQDIQSTGQYVFITYTSEQTDRRFDLSCQSTPKTSDTSTSNSKGITGGVVAVVVAVCVIAGVVFRFKYRGRRHRNNRQAAVAAPPNVNITNINTPISYPSNSSAQTVMQHSSYPAHGQSQPQTQHQYQSQSSYPVQAVSQFQPQPLCQPQYPPHQPQLQPQGQPVYPPPQPPYAVQSDFPTQQQPTAPPIDDGAPPPYPGSEPQLETSKVKQ